MNSHDEHEYNDIDLIEKAMDDMRDQIIENLTPLERAAFLQDWSRDPSGWDFSTKIHDEMEEIMSNTKEQVLEKLSPFERAALFQDWKEFCYLYRKDVSEKDL